jgi:uncharacterized iron-regulated membrane protein
MALRKVFFWLHLTSGVVAGLVILVMCVTGTLLTYEKQVTRWADGYRRAPLPGATRLPVETLLARVRATRSALPASIMLEADPTGPATLVYGREGTLFVDPHDGTVLGEGSSRARAFFRSVTDWHRWLSASGDNRARGKAVTGAANLVFLFMVMSGFYLWWPRSWTRPSLRAVTWFQGGLPGKARDFNWHNVIGIWMAVPLFFVVLGGVVISYPSAVALLYRLTGSPPPPEAPRRDAPPASANDVSLEGLNAAWAVAEGQVPAWQTLTLRLPNTADAPWTFAIDAATGAIRPDRRSQLTLDRKTGALVRFEPYESQSAGRQLRGWLRFIHTGEAFGLAGQTLAGLASAGGAVLVYTGLALSLRRFWAWRRRVV